MSAPARQEALATHEMLIPGGHAGIELHLRNKHPASLRQYTAERTVVLMHGATFPSASLFDVALGGTSVMDALARGGLDVWAVDVRGYGGSTRPPAMNGLPDGKPPVTPAATAVADLAAAVDFVCRHRGIDGTGLLGHSWGGSIAGAYASSHPHHVAKLALVAPLWLSETPLRIDPGGPLGAYRFADVRAYEAAWRVQAPEGERAALIPAGWFAAWAEATLATDPASPRPSAIRAPSGAIQDIRDHWRVGRPLYDASAIACPVLLLRGEWDADVHHAMAQSLFAALTGAPYRRWVEIGAATHMLLSEKNRWQALDAIIGFFAESFAPEM